MFICNTRNFDINYAIQNIKSIFHWELDVNENEIFTIRKLEKALRSRGMSNKQAKVLISQNKLELMSAYGDQLQAE